MGLLSISSWTDDGTPVWSREPELRELESLAQYETAEMERDIIELQVLARKQTVARDRRQLEAQVRHLEDRIEAIRAARLSLEQKERQRLEDHDDAFKRLAKPDIEAAQERFRELKRLMNEF